jgi:hypothetical protein
VGQAFTPGLMVTRKTTINKERILPLPGNVIVKKGDKVKSSDIVARTELPGNVVPLNVANLLRVLPEDVPGYMLKKEKEKIQKNELIAETKGFFGLFKSQVKSPVDGSIETISNITGQVLLREKPIPVQITAYIDGIITNVIENSGVAIETTATFIQGIFGIGRETYGEIAIAANSPNEVITPDRIDDKFKGKIVVCGSFIATDVLVKGEQVGVKGFVVGGFNAQDLKDFLGYDLGVAITGNEDKNITLLVTEGFGKLSMAENTFKLLKERSGSVASMNGATQIRAGVIRPEIVIPIDVSKNMEKSVRFDVSEGLRIGSPIRIIRYPHFGSIGEVVGLPSPLEKIETEAHVRILKVKLKDGNVVTLPRANVEMIEG